MYGGMTTLSTSKSKKILTVYAAIFAILTLACTVVRTYAVVTAYDRSVGYYDASSSLPGVAVLLSIVAVFLCTLLPFLLGKKETAVIDCFDYSPLSRIVSACYTVLVLFCAFYMALGSYYTGNVGATDMVLLAFGVVGAIYFLLVTAGKVYSRNTNNALFAYAFILFVLIVIGKTYFDYTTPMNGSNKIFFHVALMSVMLYMLTEARFILGNRAPRAYNAAALAAFFFSFSTAVHGIVGFSLGEFSKPIYFGGSVALLGFSIYVASRYIPYLKKLK